MTITPKLRQILENETNGAWKNNQIKFLQKFKDGCVFKSSGGSAQLQRKWEKSEVTAQALEGHLGSSHAYRSW